MSAGDFSSAVQAIVSEMGSRYTFEDIAGAKVTINGVISMLGKNDDQMINSLGKDGRVFYCEKLAVIPKQYDKLICQTTSEEYTVETSHQIVVDNTVVGAKIYVKGV